MRRRLLVLVPVLLLAAGCAGGSRQVAGVASSATGAATTTPSPDSGLVAFSACMRANGVPTFPDPQRLVGGNVKLTIHRLGGGPRVTAAFDACSHLLPGGGPNQPDQQSRTELEDELSFARCMRSHDVPRFPDPSAREGLTVALVEAQGIDVHSTAFLQVVQTCLPASHGSLTLAKVRDAIANAGH